MKRLLFLVLMVLVAATSWGQKRTMITDKSVVRDSMEIAGKTFKGIDDDTLLQSPSAKMVPSTEAVVKYIDAVGDRYDNTVSKLNATTQKTAIDELAEFRTIEHVDSFSTQSFAVGQLVDVRTTGSRYLIVNSSPYNLGVNGGLFARRIDKNRYYESVTELKESKTLINGEIYQVGQDNFLLSTKSNGPIDSVSVIEFPGYDIPNENLRAYSENIFGDASSSPNVSKEINKISAPNGTQSADKVTIVTSPGQFRLNLDDFELEAGVDYAVSFYMKLDENTPNDTIQIRASLGDRRSTSYFTPTTSWQRYGAVLNMGAEEFFDGVDFEHTNAGPGDYYFIWGIQVERASEIGPYVPTGIAGQNKEDIKFYLNLLPETKGILKYSTFINSGQYNNDREALQAAIDYCSELSTCRTVFLDRNVTLDSTVILKQKCVLEGLFKGGLVDNDMTTGFIYADINDSSVDLFRVDTINIPSSYVRECGLRNVYIQALSSANRALYAPWLFNGEFETIVINGGDKYFKYGVWQRNGVEANFKELEVAQCEVGWYNESGASNYIYESRFIDNKINIWVAGGGSLHLIGVGNEAPDSIGYLLTGGRLFSVAGDGERQVDRTGTTDPTVFPMVWMKNNAVANFVGGKNSGGNNDLSQPTGQTFKVDGGQLTVQGGRYAAFARGVTAGPDAALININGAIGLSIEWDSIPNPKIVNVDGGLKDARIYSYKNNAEIESSRLLQNQTEQTTAFKESLKDTISFDRRQVIRSSGENLFSQSEFLSTAWNSLPFSTATIVNNDTISPSGDNDAAKILVSNISNNGIRYTNSIIEYPKKYYISFWVHPGNRNIESLIVNLGDEENYPLLIDTGGEWQKFKIIVWAKTNPRVGNHVDFEFNGALNDYLFMWGFQAVELPDGAREGETDLNIEYIETTGAPITNDSIFEWELEDDWVVSGGKKMALISDFSLSGVFGDKDDDGGTFGQLLKSTGTGTDWGNADAGNVDIADIAGGYASTSVEGALQELTMQTEVAPTNASTIAVTKYRCIIAIDNLEGSTQTQTINTANIPDGAEIFIKSNASVSVTFSLSSGNFVPLGSTTGQSTIAISGTGELKLLWSSDLNVFYQL